MKQAGVDGFHPYLDVRIGTADDVPAIADLASRLGQDPSTTAYECERALREPFGFSAVVTARTPSGDRILACENAVLLRPRWGKKIRCGVVPFSQLLKEEPERFVANETEVGHANAGSGLDLFITHFFVDNSGAASYERLMAILAAGFVDRFVGNHIRSIMYETSGFENAAEAEHSGFTISNVYEDWHRATGGSETQRPILLFSDLERAMRNHSLHAARLLHYQPPTLRFPPAAREILRCAYLGSSDAEIIAELGLTNASLNSRWTRILDATQRRMPDLLGHRGGSRDRRPLLSYLQNYPEEMWPYEPVKDGT